MALNNHFQMMDQSDYDRIAKGDSVTMQAAKPLQFYGIIGLREMSNKQIGAIAAVKQAVELRRTKVEAVNNDPSLSTAFKAARVEELNKKYAGDIDAAMATVVELAADASTQSVFWSRGAALQRCSFVKDPAKDAANDAVIRADYRARIARMPAAGLLSFARLAAAQAGEDRAKSAAIVACLQEELDARQAETPPALPIGREDAVELRRLMDTVSAFDVEARYLIENMRVSTEECVLLTSDRRGDSTRLIAAAIRREAVNALPKE